MGSRLPEWKLWIKTVKGNSGIKTARMKTLDQNGQGNFWDQDYQNINSGSKRSREILESRLSGWKLWDEDIPIYIGRVEEVKRVKIFPGMFFRRFYWLFLIIVLTLHPVWRMVTTYFSLLIIGVSDASMVWLL